MVSSVRMDVKEVLRHFQELEDPRSSVNRLHPLDSVVVIAIMAVLAGANGPTAIARWANIKAEVLLKLLDLPHGIPQKDVFRRVLATLKPDAFQACFTMWLTALRAAAAEATGVERPTLAIDGKTLRRSHDRRRNLGALHSVSVWASEFGLTLAQVATAEKSNEITAIPVLLSLVDIQGAIITIDAMGTQTAIAEKIIDGGGDYLLALKGNQGTLHDAAIDYIHEQTKTRLPRDRRSPLGHRGKEARPDREANLSSDARPQEPAGVQALEGTALDRDRLSLVHPRWKRDRRGALFHQQSARQGETVCPRGSQSLGNREQLSLVPRCDVSRG